jgi:hypothetical protein
MSFDVTSLETQFQLVQEAEHFEAVIETLRCVRHETKVTCRGDKFLEN